METTAAGGGFWRRCRWLGHLGRAARRVVAEGQIGINVGQRVRRWLRMALRATSTSHRAVGGLSCCCSFHDGRAEGWQISQGEPKDGKSPDRVKKRLKEAQKVKSGGCQAMVGGCLFSRAPAYCMWVLSSSWLAVADNIYNFERSRRQHWWFARYVLVGGRERQRTPRTCVRNAIQCSILELPSAPTP